MHLAALEQQFSSATIPYSEALVYNNNALDRRKPQEYPPYFLTQVHNEVHAP